jgi:hypothetical protein
MKITVNDSSFKSKSTLFMDRVQKAVAKAIDQVANEILRLSSFEVPHDTGMLQSSGHVEIQTDKSAIVGYNKVYAARLHEHPEYRFQKGRKGKYLEDPIKHNYKHFLSFIQDGITGIEKA